MSILVCRFYIKVPERFDDSFGDAINKFLKILPDLNGDLDEIIVDFEGNKFQYDDTSRSRLAETKDDARVTFWRSVDNKNIPLTNAKKNSLHKILIETYFTEFAKKSQVIDGL